jgi:OPA family glycerol-3-phosphate transporter-like MFS transporter
LIRTRIRPTRGNVVFAVSRLTYAAFYLCRKNFSVVMPILSRQMGLSNATLGEILFGLSAAYAVGQFSMGILADLVGARWTVPAGMGGFGDFRRNDGLSP